HVRIDAAYLHFPLRVRAVLDVLSLIALGAVTVAMLDRCFDLTYSNFIEWNRSNTPLRTPLALPQIPWVLGFALFLFAIGVALARTLLALGRGDYGTASRTAGVSSQDEEIESELASLGIAVGKRGAPPRAEG
ncbi:MAG TPA: TRAP transporter small permease subunit, partial [Reyranella sp.]|nr:TRAP transporter small permease subunit [Reyranella sp.]